ncbi:inactive C-alpha-formylglycine-generating enzyme 2 isoform X5 [Phyllopteryx taeniolatus]|uniref:inactive C-alpha-formylglycine-generating enzyme 2 isoform X5 n=1 Tax=Phyllopteryx taeniolatus TaxID=161469 RepID=UPI002AD5974D|nr:inactive C-alpha-formylglycine-generating enzyme 2 isoform X5 [Phyllopteryx taeniolatus]
MLFRCLWCVGLLSVITAAAAEENDGMVAIPGGRMTTTTTRSYGRAEDEETEIQLLPFLLDKQPVTNSAFRDFVRDQKYKTEAETFGWSFVFQDFVSEDIKGKVTHTIKSAPWWLPVERAFWRQVCSSVLFFFLFFSELGFRPSAHVAHTQPAGAGSGIAARLDFPVVQARRFPGGSASGPIGATCGRARFRTATRRRTDITASLPSTPSRRRTTSDGQHSRLCFGQPELQVRLRRPRAGTARGLVNDDETQKTTKNDNVETFQRRAEDSKNVT